MANNRLSMQAQERSTYIIKAEFYAKTSDGSAPSPVIPNAGLTWTLRDKDGVVVNARLNQSLTPGESVVIALIGDDLALAGNYPEKRYLTIEGTFDSELGVNLPLVDEVEFTVGDLVGKGPG